MRIMSFQPSLRDGFSPLLAGTQGIASLAEQIGFGAQLQQIEILEKCAAIDGLLVFPGIIDEPDAFDAIAGGIESDAEFGSDLAAPAGRGFIVSGEPDQGFRPNGLEFRSSM